MFKQSRGISAVLAVVVVIITIAVAATAIYFVAVPGSTTSASSSSSSSHSTSSQSSSSVQSSTTQQSSSSTSSPMQSSTTQQSSSSTSSSVQSTSQSTQLTSTFTNTYTACTYTTGLTNTNASLANLYKSFSQMEIAYYLTSMNMSMTSSYTAVSVNATTFKVNVNMNMSAMGMSIPENGTFWVRTDGTVVAGQAWMSMFGMTEKLNGSSYNNIMGPFVSELTYGAQANFYTSASYFKQTGTGTRSFPPVPTTMSVTNYTANNTPETISECGTSMTLDAFSLQIGTLPSSNLQILTAMNFSGTVEGEKLAIAMSLISLTPASS